LRIINIRRSCMAGFSNDGYFQMVGGVNKGATISSARVTGTVTQGAVVAGAAVTLTSEETDHNCTVTTNRGGHTITLRTRVG
jgi:hypothetical protein